MVLLLCSFNFSLPIFWFNF